MDTTYTPEDHVRRFIIHTSSSPALLLNEEAFKDFYNQHVNHHGLPSNPQSTRSSYQATKSQPQDHSTGMSAFDDSKGTPITASNEKMILDNDEATSDISDELEHYNPLHGCRGKIVLTSNTSGNARINELNHNINQGHSKLEIHITKGVNHLQIKISELSDLGRAQSASISQLTNLVHSLATQVQNLSTQAPPKNNNNNNSSSSKPNQAANTHNTNANARQQIPKPQAPGNYTQAAKKVAEAPFQTVQKKQQRSSNPNTP